MKKGIQTSSFDKTGYGRWGENIYKKIKEHGYSCSDFNMSVTESELYQSREKADELIKKEKNLAEEAGVTINQVHGPWRWPPRDSTKEDREERMEKMKESIRMTKALGCKNWVVHPLMPFGVNDIGEGKTEETKCINIKFMKELLKTAKEYDVTICLENMPMLGFSLSKPEAVYDFVREINDENFKICLDTGHVSVFEELNLAEETKKLGKEIKVLHIHDNKLGEDLHLMPYFGIINWADFYKALKDIEFDGCFSLETMPSRKLSDDIFEEMCKSLFKIVEKICEVK